MKIAVIGNCPSAGSSLLADLLDSTEYSACGEEINLFSNRKIYNFKEFKHNIASSSSASSIHRIRNRLNFHQLHLYGLNKRMLSEIIAASPNLDDFLEQFALRFMALRGKRSDGILFEKTPENIDCIGEFLNAFPNFFFVHITRNPLYIYPSLLKRRFPKYIALISWLIDVAKYIKYKDHERVISVKYEDLVQTPFVIVKNILEKTVGISHVSEEIIRLGFENNNYRRLFTPRIKTWNVTSYGTISNANIEKNGGNLKELRMLLNVKVSGSYARFFNIAEVSFVEALQTFGYYDEVVARLNKSQYLGRMPQKTLADYLWLLLKWGKDFQQGDAGLEHLKVYLNPIERNRG